MSDVDFTGKRVLVTGSGTGIGRGIALAFARAGADVALHYSQSAKGAASALEEIRRAGGRAEAFQADFTDIEQVRALAGQATAFLGGIDILVNNAGITMTQPFGDVTVEQFDTVFNVNIRAMFFLSQAVVADMVGRRGGCIVNLTSIHAFEGLMEHSVYAAAKGAIVSFTRGLAIELAPQGIRVNAIAPGCIEVEGYADIIPNYDRQETADGIPAGFVGMPQDVAATALFLASDAARFIVGQTLVVDGGTTSWMPFGPGFREPTGDKSGKGYVPGL